MHFKLDYNLKCRVTSKAMKTRTDLQSINSQQLFELITSIYIIQTRKRQDFFFWPTQDKTLLIGDIEHIYK